MPPRESAHLLRPAGAPDAPDAPPPPPPPRALEDPATPSSGDEWGHFSSVPEGFDVDAYRTELVAPVCPRVHERHSQWKTVAEWRALGVTPYNSLPSDALVSLFQPDGPGTPAWLLTSNYRVILEYNCSNYYAMSVGLLADEIAR